MNGGRTLVSEIRDQVAAAAARSAQPVARGDVADLAARILDDQHHILTRQARQQVVQQVVDEVTGLGPLEALLRDPTITEIMVNGPDQVFVERDGRLAAVDVHFDDDAHLLHTIDRMIAPLGRRVDEASPMVDGRLADGSRVNAVIAPVSLAGPVLTVRRFGEERLDVAGLVTRGTLSAEVADLLQVAVRARKNILVTGGTGSGKTTTLAAICAFVPDGERIVTIEDAAELRLSCPHVVRLESRPPNLEGGGAIPIRALVRNALRMRPDRIIVGEVRGGECVDMLAAMTTGHEGSLSTLHASSPDDAVRRLQTLALMGDVEIPYVAVAEQVANAIDLIVHQSRMADGSRRVMQVTALAPSSGAAVLTPLVQFVPTAAGRGEGQFVWADAASGWLATARADDHHDGSATEA